MKRLTLRKMLSLYTLIAISAIIFLFIIFFTVFMYGARHNLYSFANAEEKQVEILQQRIESKKYFDPNWVPQNIAYIAIDKENRIVSSNTSLDNQKRALDFYNGKSIPSSEGYFVKVSYPKGSCVFIYHIGIRYSSDWANRHLPRVDYLMIMILIMIISVTIILFIHAIAHRLQKDVLPLKNIVVSIGRGNLNLPVPSLSIEEFNEFGALLERMRLDLKRTLEVLWTNEQQIKEETTQMLHDYRSPLTVARANAEFLKEDLSLLENGEEKENFLKYTDALILQLDCLTEIADQLQQRMTAQDIRTVTKESINFNTFNQIIDRIGMNYSEYYESNWQCRIQNSQKPLPIDEMAFKQALINLLINAFEHGKSSQTVQLEFKICNSKAEYLIINSGSCFSQAALLHATDKGFSEKGNDEHLLQGQGLYFVKRFLQENGGCIDLSNTSDGHACVKVVLPLESSLDGA